MNKRTASALISLAFSGLLAGCGGGGGAAPPAPPPPPPPPVAPMSAAGIWVGSAVTPDAMDISTSFEFSDSNGFTMGTAPFTVDFQGGNAQTIGNPAFYEDGAFSWHISSAGASIVFGVPVESVTLWTRTTTNGDVATIQVLDEFGAQISLTAVTDNFVQIVEIPGMGAPLIGSVVIAVDAGDEIVVDTFTSGFPSTASTDDIACVLALNDEFVCIISDETTGALLGGANGTYSVNGDQVSGTGSLYAAPGETLADGSTVADLTISAGTVVESTSLNVTVDSTGLSIAVTSLFDDTYDRVSDLATVAETYTDLDIFGDMFSLTIDGAGVISGLSLTTGCVLSGLVSVIDAAANVYDVDLVADAATCGALGGTYDGFGSSQDEAAMDDSFIFAVFVDGVKMIAGLAIK